MRKNINLLIFFIIFVILAVVVIPTKSEAANTYYQYVKSGINAFPNSYQVRLNQIASKYPNWRFQAYYTGISWDELIQKERGNESEHRNRVTVNAPSSWKHCSFMDKGWACASDAAVKYYMDPRNFLNETQIFQFVESSYNPQIQTLSVIQNSVKNTFLDDTITCKDLNNNTVTISYSEIIIEAAIQSNISAFYIKSKIIQEVSIGRGKSGSVTGTYPGYEGYYNFYNYGANDTGDPIANGLEFAKRKGWNSPYKAIVDGAKLIGSDYINQGQNTAYFNKWDVVGTKILRDGESQTVSSSNMFWHQYMTNIQDPTSQSYSNRKLYENSLDSQITFIIPVYNNMPASNSMPQDVSVQGVNLNKNIFVVDIDQTGDVVAEVLPSNATNKDIVWTVSDPEKVRVWNGHFRGLKEGSATITATTVDGGYSASCKVIVRDPNKKYVENIQIEKDQYISYIDEAFDINYNCYPTDAVNTDLYWTTDNPDVIRIFGNRYRGLKEGVAKIIAITDDGKVRTESKVIIRDRNKAYVDKINIYTKEYTVDVNEAVDIPYSYEPSNATNAEFYWTSSNDKILRVYGNRFRALKPGIAEVIVRTLDGTIENRIKVIVSNPGGVKNIVLDETEYIVDENEAVDIPYSYEPSNATNAEFYWTSSNDDVLRVWGNRFRALKPGIAEVIVRTLDGTAEKRAKVTVVKSGNVKNIVLDKVEYTVEVDEAVDIPYSYEPSNATNAEFYWTSSNDEVLRVFGNRFRALKPGIAEVIVRTLDGTIEKRAKVIISKPGNVNNIILDKTEYTVEVDEAVDIPYSYEPSNAINAEFYWTSSNDEVLRVFGNRFRALKPGIAEVIVRTLDGTIEKRAKVIISKPGNVNNIILDKTEYTVEVDEAVDIPYSYEPSNATNAEFYWTSSNDEVLRVFGNRFRALKPGIAEVIVRTLDGTIEKRAKVIISKPGNVNNIILDKTEYTVEVDEAVDIPYSYEPSNATNAEFYWTSSNDEILRVWGNRFRALKPGTAEVIVRTLDGTVEKRIEVTVK